MRDVCCVTPAAIVIHGHVPLGLSEKVSLIYLLWCLDGSSGFIGRAADLCSPSVSLTRHNNRRSAASSPPVFTSQDTQLCVVSYVIQARVH